MIVDETWLHWYTAETKEQSKQRLLLGERASKKAKALPSAGKVHGDYLEKGKAITGVYYVDFLGRFNTDLKKKAEKKVLFHQDNCFPILRILGIFLPATCFRYHLKNRSPERSMGSRKRKLQHRWKKCELKGDYIE